MSWLVIGGFSIAVAFVLVQLFKYFVTAPELAAVEASKSRGKNPKKGTTSTQKSKKEKATDSTPKESSSQESAPAKAKPSVSSSESSKEVKPAKENKQSKQSKKSQKENTISNNINNEAKAASSGSEAVDAEKPAAVVPAAAAADKKKEKGKKAVVEKKVEEPKKPKENKKKRNDFATELTEEDLSKQWQSDYQPSASVKETVVSTPEPWRQVGQQTSNDNTIEKLKKQISDLETSLELNTYNNKVSHEKYQETLSKATKAHASAEQALQSTISRLQRDLDSLREGGSAANDSLRAKNYSNAERSARPAASLSSLIADEQKQKGKEKEQEEAKAKENEERERQEKARAEKERERQEKDNQSNDKDSLVFKQKLTDLEAKHREVAEQLKASEAVNSFLTATLAAEARSAKPAVVAAAPDQSAELTKKIDELTQQLAKSKQDAEKSKQEAEKSRQEVESQVKALNAQLKDSHAEVKGAEETHTQALAEANTQIEKLRAQLTALEASSAKGSGNEEAIKQLQQSLNEEKEKTDAANQVAELAEAAKLSYKSKFEDAQKASEELQAKIESLKKEVEESSKGGDQRLKTLEAELASAKSARSDDDLKHAQALEAEQKRASELKDALTSAQSEKDKAVASLSAALSEKEKAVSELAAFQAQKSNADKELSASFQTEKETLIKERDEAVKRSTTMDGLLKTTMQKLKDAQAAGNDKASTEQLVSEAKAQIAEAVQRAEEANKRTAEATAKADEAAKSIKELSDEIENLKTKAAGALSEEQHKAEISKLNEKYGEFEAKLQSAEAKAQEYKSEAESSHTKLNEEKAARDDVIRRLEEVSARVKELEAQPQAGGSAGLKLTINSPNVIPAETEQQ